MWSLMSIGNEHIRFAARPSLLHGGIGFFGKSRQLSAEIDYQTMGESWTSTPPKFN